LGNSAGKLYVIEVEKLEVFMMFKWFALIVLVLLLAACAQASTITVQNPTIPPALDTPTQAEQPGADASPTPAPGVVSLSGEQTQAAQSNNGSTNNSAPEASPPTVEWDANPATVVITATNCCGLTTPFYHNNYIPDALVWGDGRILWTQTGATGSRQVFEGQLSSTQLQSWLQGAVDAGFFGWKPIYKDDINPTDLPTRCITIKLANQDRQVCEYFQGAPEAYQKLYDQLNQGLGIAGTPFIPQRAYLTAYSFPKTNLGNDGGAQSGKTPQWNENTAGVSLANAGNGVWLEGAAVKQAWELVNQNPMAPSVEENGQTYQLTLQVPGISFSAPPSQ
jgi:hypothetical protein